MRLSVFVMAALAWGVVGGSRALAQVSGSSTEAVSSRDMRALAADWLILPQGTWTLGGDLRFLTAEGGLGEGALRFTDAVLLDLHARASVAGKAELFGGLTLLPKQPSGTGEVLWQGASLGGRVGFARRFAATVTAETGPLLGHRGNWLITEAGVEARKSLHPTLRLQGALLGAGTVLFRDGGTEGRPGFAEVVADAEVSLRVPSGEAAVWLGTQFRFPVGTFSQTAGAEGALNPQTRVNVRVGGVLSYIENWDIYAQFVVVDRGDLRDPATTLPILDGGFDQDTFLFGLTHRFGKAQRRRYGE